MMKVGEPSFEGIYEAFNRPVDSKEAFLDHCLSLSDVGVCSFPHTQGLCISPQLRMKL
jgi:hypothetical protein